MNDFFVRQVRDVKAKICRIRKFTKSAPPCGIINSIQLIQFGHAAVCLHRKRFSRILQLSVLHVLRNRYTSILINIAGVITE